MSELQMLDLIKVFLVDQAVRPSSEHAGAWEDFFRIYDPVIRAVVTKYHLRRHDVEDTVQEVWKVLVRELPRLCYDPARGPLRKWVATVAHHTALRQARRLSRQRIEALTSEYADALTDPEPDPVTLSERSFHREQVRTILAVPIPGLPEVSHRIIYLRWIEERSVSEIAFLIGIPEDQVWPRLRRGLAKLRVQCCRSGLEPP